jgi:ABC-type multidrug transport system ATPase subunit
MIARTSPALLARSAEGGRPDILLSRKRWSRVLRGVDLEMRAGEILCIVGPNGAGKSMLINIITDTREPSGGSVVLQVSAGGAAPRHYLGVKA